MKPDHFIIALMLLTALPMTIFGSENLQFSGTLIVPPVCTVSDQGGRINVHFKQNISTKRIDGEQYRQTVGYRIDCTAGSFVPGTWRMHLTVRAIGADFDKNAIQTSVADLGIKLILGGSNLLINQPREISIDSPTNVPVLEAVPVKRAGAELPSIEFTASALLIAEVY